jgi:hypothetical protein
LQPDTAGIRPAFRCDHFLRSASGGAVADILSVTLLSVSVTDLEIEEARRCIDNAAFRRVEKLLSLKSPNDRFRREILDTVAVFRRHPNPALRDRKSLGELRKHLSKVRQHLLALQKLLPANRGCDSVQSSFVLAILGKPPRTNGIFDSRDYLKFTTLLNAMVEATNATSAELNNERVPPNSQLGAAKQLVRQLADIFSEKTNKRPEDHFGSNYSKDTYRGEFFEMADEILGLVGVRQSHAARGRMIAKLLRKPSGRR